MVKDINLLEEIDSASKIHVLKRDDIDALMLEFAKRITAALQIERMSVWLFNDERTAIISMGEYDTRTKSLKNKSVLSKSDFPTYFSALEENKIILAPNIREDLKTKEFTENYSIPNDIISLMDIPLRIMGDIVGVMCFEKCGNKERVFNEKEQTFAFALATVFASNLEARHRRAYQHQLEEAINEKEVLIKEISHRVKNNFSILISLLRLSKNQVKSSESKLLAEEFEQRIFSMMKIHDLLSQTNNHVTIPLVNYIHELIKEFKSAHPEIADKIIFISNSCPYVLETKQAISLGLIITEIFLNSVKHAFSKQMDIEFMIELNLNEKANLEICMGNTGNGFDFEKKVNENTLGLSLIKDLVGEVCEEVQFPNNKNGNYILMLN